MNKKLMAVAVAGAIGAPGLAFAQAANVNIYGVMDARWDTMKFTGNTAGTINNLTKSHFQHQASRWGLRGSEDLGGGLSAFFQLESGLSPDGRPQIQSDTGGIYALGGRDSWIGIRSNSWGEIKGGGFGTAYKAVAGVWHANAGINHGGIVMGNGDSTGAMPSPNCSGGISATGTPTTSTGTLAGGTVSVCQPQVEGGATAFSRRESNYVEYTSPTFSGFQVKIGTAASEMAEPTSTTTALGAGAVNYALVIRTGHHPAGVRYRQISTNRAPGGSAFSTPYGHGVGGAGQAVTYQRYLAKYGAKRESMWGYIGTAHKNGQDTPQSVWRGRMITEEDYLNARLIAYPMNIFDNDMPCDGVLAVVMTTEDRAKSTPHPGGYITGMSALNWHLKTTGAVDTLEELEVMGRRMANNLYDMSGFGPKDVNVKHVYDGFSPMVWEWVEAFGFCEYGEAPTYCQPENIGLGKANVLNASGGNLGNGRIHGFSHVLETAMQMMGTAGPRQIPNAEVAICETGPFNSASCFSCTND